MKGKTNLNLWDIRIFCSTIVITGLIMSGVSWSKINQLRAIFQQREFQADLSKIAVATSKVKQTLIAACLEILNHQRELPPDGADLMRSIAILLDCPIPSRLSQASAQRVRG